MEGYAGYKKTNLKTMTNWGWRIVYTNKEGRLFYRMSNTWFGTFRSYCVER